MRRMNQLCSSSSSASFSFLMISCAAALSFQRFFGASSPPMWMYSLGKTSMTSRRMFSRNVNVASLGEKTSSEIPQVVRTSNGPGTFANSGYAARAARLCPGISISGNTVTPRSFAYPTTSRAWAWV